MKIQDVKLKVKFMVAFLLVGLVPFAVIGTVSSLKAKAALEKQAYDRLTAVREIKKAQIDDYLKQAFLDMAVFSRSKDVAELHARLILHHNQSNAKDDGPINVNTPEYKQIYDTYGDNILRFCKDSGFQDVVITCAAHGHVLFTCAKDPDLGTNLHHGPYRESNLAQLWARVVKTDNRSIVDFAPYAPAIRFMETGERLRVSSRSSFPLNRSTNSCNRGKASVRLGRPIWWARTG
jgi:methyl-accepting chemotaxis protein